VLAISESARRYLAQKGYDPAYGARPLNRLIQDKLKKPLADELLFGKLTGGGEVNVDLVADELSFKFLT
jgi:ATP-dependent Clp protease ATP-binding subunit ClpA